MKIRALVLLFIALLLLAVVAVSLVFPLPVEFYNPDFPDARSIAADRAAISSGVVESGSTPTRVTYDREGLKCQFNIGNMGKPGPDALLVVTARQVIRDDIFDDRHIHVDAFRDNRFTYHGKTYTVEHAWTVSKDSLFKNPRGKYHLPARITSKVARPQWSGDAWFEIPLKRIPLLTRIKLQSRKAAILFVSTFEGSPIYYQTLVRKQPVYQPVSVQ